MNIVTLEVWNRKKKNKIITSLWLKLQIKSFSRGFNISPNFYNKKKTNHDLINYNPIMTEERKFDRYLLTTFLIFVLCSIIRGVPFSLLILSFRFQFQEGPLHSDFITREKTMLLLFIYLWSCTMICSRCPAAKIFV